MPGKRRLTLFTALASSLLLVSCASHSLEDWLLRHAFVAGPQPVVSGGPSLECRMEAVRGVAVAARRIDWSLGQPVRLAGYGLFPFWRVGLGDDVTASGPVTDRVTGSLLLMRGSEPLLGAPADRPVWWMLLSLDTLGVASSVAEALAAAAQGVLGTLALPGGSPQAPCTMVTLVASHSHSGPDLTGLWGAAAQSWSASTNARLWQQTTLHALAESMTHDVVELSRDLRVSHVSLGQAHVGTSATERQPLNEEGNLTVVRFPSAPTQIQDGDQQARPDPAIWIWDAHATTVDRARTTPDGDFPAAVAARLSSSISAIFVPGGPAAQYPVTEQGWTEELAEVVGRAASAEGQSLSVHLREDEVCLYPEALHAPLFLAWSPRWGVAVPGACTALAGGPSGGIKVRLQKVVFASGSSVGTGGPGASASLYFVPFEMSAAASRGFLVALRGSHDRGQEAVSRVVSLSNGFLGHGLSAREADVITGVERSEDPLVVRPYHLWMSLVRSVQPTLEAWAAALAD